MWGLEGDSVSASYVGRCVGSFEECKAFVGSHIEIQDWAYVGRCVGSFKECKAFVGSHIEIQDIMWGLEGDSVSATDLKSLRNILTVTMISKISDPVISNPVMAATTFDNSIIWSIRGYNTSSLPNRSSQTVIEQGNIW